MAGLTLALMPNLLQSRSAIINLSSFLGETAAPYSTVYSATKAFNTFFSECLAMEKNMNKLDILSVRPMYVESPLSKKKKAFMVPDRRQCALACLKELRWEYETNGYYLHRVLGLSARMAPKWVRRLVARY